jgi:hypothetical protein
MPHAKAARRPAPPRRPRVPAPDEKAAALRMFAAGTAAPAAAKALGVSRATAYRWWAEHRAAQANSSPSGAVPVPAGLDGESRDTAPPGESRDAPKAPAPPPPPAAAAPGSGGGPAAQPPPDAEQEWATRLAMAAAYRWGR